MHWSEFTVTRRSSNHCSESYTSAQSKHGTSSYKVPLSITLCTRFLCLFHFVEGSSVYCITWPKMWFTLKSWWLWPSNWNANCTSLLLSSSMLSPYFQEHSIIIWGLWPSRLYPVSLIADYQGFGICLAFVHLLLVLVYWNVFGVCAGW